MILIFLFCLIECILSQDFQFATYTSTEASAQPSNDLTQNNTSIDNNVLINVTQAESSCTPGVLIGTFNLIGIFRF